MVFNALEWDHRTKTFPKLSNKQVKDYCDKLKTAMNLDHMRIESEKGAQDEYRPLNYRTVCSVIDEYEGRHTGDPEAPCKRLWGDMP